MNVFKPLAPFERNALSAAVCLGLTLISPNIQAVTFNADTSADLLNGSPAVTDSQTNPSSVVSSSSQLSSTGDSFSIAKGDDTGRIYTRAEGQGTFSSVARIQQVVNFTNTSAFAQSYAFDYMINPGSLVNADYSILNIGDFISTSNTVSIKLDGTEIFNSEATLRTIGTASSVVNSSSLATNGAVLGTYTSNAGFYGWTAFSGTLDLGIFNPNQSFTIEYDITTYASSNLKTSTCSTLGDGYGCAKSQFGDPNSISGTPIDNTTVTGTQVSSVPEAGALLLFGTGLAGLAFTRRRKARKH